MGRSVGYLLDRELRRRRLRHPESAVTRIHPDRAMARVAGLRPLALFEDERARAVYPMALEQGLAYGQELVRSWALPRAGTDPGA